MFGSLRHPARPQPAQQGHALRYYPGNGTMVTHQIFERHSIPRRMAGALHLGTTLISPCASGRFVPGDKGSPVRRAYVRDGAPDLGVLQRFRGAVGRPMLARLGAQSGPSSQPAYPSTGGANPLVALLAQQGAPDVIRWQL